MRYYLNSATQTKTDEGGYTSYGKKETTGIGKAGFDKAEADMLSNCATMIKTAKVQYYVAKVEDDKGNVLKKYEVGEYVEVPESED